MMHWYCPGARRLRLPALWRQAVAELDRQRRLAGWTAAVYPKLSEAGI